MPDPRLTPDDPLARGLLPAALLPLAAQTATLLPGAGMGAPETPAPAPVPALAAEPAVDPLDLTGLMPAEPAPQTGVMPAPAADRAAERRAALKLALLLPLATTAGPGAIQGLLQGFAQARQRQQQQAQEQAAAAQAEAARQAQQATQQQAQRSAFLQRFTAGLKELDSPAAVEAYVALHAPLADALGVGRRALERYVRQTQAPTQIQRRAAQRRLEALKAQFGSDWMTQAAQFTHELGDERLTFPELLARAGLAPDPQAPAAAPAKEPPPSIFSGTSEFATAGRALEAQFRAQHGREPTPQEQVALVEQAGRLAARPADPELAALTRQIAQARLEQAQQAARPTALLPPRVQRAVDAQARGFDQQPVVRRIQTLGEAASFVQHIDPQTARPSDDQALIYTFAKAMDPDSAVREGEYQTIQKYNQSWLERFGFNAVRVLQNTAFLTPEARRMMKATILERYAAAKRQYDQVRREYARRISRITGEPDGETYLIDYTGGVPDVDEAKPTAGGVSTATPGSPAPAPGSRLRIGRFEVEVR